MEQFNMQELAGALKQPVNIDTNGIPSVALPPGWTLETLEETLPNPTRARASVELNEFGSLIDYVNKFKSDATAAFAEVDASGNLSFVVVIDYHEPNKPHHREHRVSFKAVRSAQFTNWLAQNDKSQAQPAMIDFLYRNRRDIIAPSAADMLEVLNDLKLTTKGEFRDIKDEFTGTQKLTFNVDVKATSAKTEKEVVLPTHITVSLQPYLGFETLALSADFMVSQPSSDGPVVLRYRFDDLANRMIDAANTACNRFTDATGLVVYRGKP